MTVRTVHLYPFRIGRLHGGTLRLRTAVEATPHFELYCFDASDERWTGPFRSLDAARTPDDPQASRSSLPQRAKRTVFPATLLESGRSAVAGGSELLRRIGVDDRTVVVLHTDYLAPLIREVAALGGRSLLDIYDLVWRAHVLDARSGPLIAALPRAAYAWSVRLREAPYAAGADAVAVAGWADWRRVQASATAAEWVPTGIDIQPVPQRSSDDGRLRVGLLGNFAHHPTRDSARELLASRLARDNQVQVVLAGYGSKRAASAPGNVTLLGELDSPESFYAAIDVAAIPASSGAGMKVKVAEAVLAGRPVLTSPLGASGFPPGLQQWLHTVDDFAGLTFEACLRAMRKADPKAAAQDFGRLVSRPASVARYAAVHAALTV